MRGIPRQAVHNNTKIKGTDVRARQIAKRASICQWNTDMYGVDPEKEGQGPIMRVSLNCMHPGAWTSLNVTI